MLTQDAADRPPECSDRHGDQSDWRCREPLTANEQQHTDEAYDDAEGFQERGPDAKWQAADSDERGYDGDEGNNQTGANCLLGIRHSSLIARNHDRAQHCGIAPLDPGWHPPPPPERPQQKRAPRREQAATDLKKRRKTEQRELDRKVCRSPDK